ncbi:DNA ligase D [Bacillus sp. 1NLA3E]|uniref:DNA ligase D n=1 Tax=Bacillus sp. 1NLA3E TaxID=666686 RepID=UPI0002DE2E81|nr:DNA ligase D [Bacillus sp. 1NLA3E]
MKPMLPSLTFNIPEGVDWYYEVKYDGFRAILEWNVNNLTLTSRNGKPLLALFPEIELFLLRNKEKFAPFLPLALDGELVFLENPYKADFGSIQVRGRMRSQKKILEKAELQPCFLLVFDVLHLQGVALKGKPYIKRKGELTKLFTAVDLPLVPSENNSKLVQMIPSKQNFQSVWDNVVLYDGEGIVAKQELNLWEDGKRSISWLKYKNWKYVSCFITAYDKSNGYFYIGVFKGGVVYPIGLFLFGLTPEEKQALVRIIKDNQIREDAQFVYVPPAICVEVKYLEVYEKQLREPHFHQFRFDLKAEDCIIENFIYNQKNLPLDIEITHPEKPIWETPPVTKIDYIHYLQEVSPYILPFLKDRALTVIRHPHGMFGEPFYQKNRPDYAPDYVHSFHRENIDYIVCNNFKTLLWLGNQLAIEFHIPFQTINNAFPSEIVLDLDPPSKKDFHLAIKAALLIKEVLDHLNLISFVKTSGNKGLQIYLPLQENQVSYDDTRLFTAFIAEYLVSKDPDSFTIERMKKNRGNRLYVDYVQHGEGKTIIAPYSLRGTGPATVATPLYWHEVTDKLTAETFNITNMVERIRKVGDPFQTYFEAKKIQNIKPILEFLAKKR